MPDKTRKTISASQGGALVGQSKYMTPWMLYHWLRGDEVREEESERMSWGKKLQPLLLEQAAEDLKLEVTANPTDTFIRRGLFGATRDATVLDPSKGVGALETKAVFDYKVWMERWNGGKDGFIPIEYEIQLQIQMLVGAGEGGPFDWGVVAAWVCGDMHYFNRKPDLELWSLLSDKAEEMFNDVDLAREPDAFGEPIEIPLLNKLYPRTEPTVLELLDDTELGETARMYAWATEQAKVHKKTADQCKAKLLGAAKENEKLVLPGAYVNIGKSQTAEKLFKEEDVGKVARKASVRTTLKVDVVEPVAGQADDNAEAALA